MAAAASLGDAEPKAQRLVYLGGWTRVPVFDFLALAAEQLVSGPAVIESDTTTVLLRVGDTARFDRRGWLDLTVGR
jgi:N-methylhydantoinase A